MQCIKQDIGVPCCVLLELVVLYMKYWKILIGEILVNLSNNVYTPFLYFLFISVFLLYSLGFIFHPQEIIMWVTVSVIIFVNNATKSSFENIFVETLSLCYKSHCFHTSFHRDYISLYSYPQWIGFPVTMHHQPHELIYFWSWPFWLG